MACIKNKGGKNSESKQKKGLKNTQDNILKLALCSQYVAGNING